MTTIIFEDPRAGLVIESSTEYSPEFMAILNDTVWGTKDTLYKMHNLEREFLTFREPYYITLKENSLPIAICLYNRKGVKIDGVVYDCCYLCLVAVKPDRSGQGFGTLMVTRATDYFLRRLGSNGFVYGHVEADNEKSLKMFAKSNFDCLADFSAPVFSRISPRRHPGTVPLEQSRIQLMLDLLNEYYRDYPWTDFDYSFDPQNYYVFIANGEIVAGIQAKEFCWTIAHLPGIGGRIIIKTFHRLPVLKNLFNPRNYRFLKIGNLYVKNGFERELLKLVEAVMATKGLKSCLAYINTQTTHDQQIAGMLRSGLLSASSQKAKVFFKSNDSRLKSRLSRRPLCISIADSI